MKLKSIGIATLLAACLGLSQAAAQTNYHLTVKAGPLRQSFAGFGFSDVRSWDMVPAATRAQMNPMVFGALHTNTVRFWVDCTDATTVASMLDQFNTRYITTNALAEALQNGVTKILLAPCGTSSTPPASASNYAEKLAEFILQLKNTYGITIHVTGLANEPGSWSPQLIVDGVNYLRAGLDSRGLTSVEIIAPESSNNDSALNERLDVIYADGTAWDNIIGIASHSYGMAPGNTQEARKRDKEFWMTEASENGHEVAEDEDTACTILARFLNDMNHSVDRWIYFIGYFAENNVATESGAPDSKTKLMTYDLATSSIFIHLKYYYFLQALNAIDTNSIFRRCESATEADMPYTYMSYSAINSAAAVNPDGSWGIGIVNDTGVSTSGTLRAGFTAAATYNVIINVEELANTPSLTFNVYRTRANNHYVSSGPLTLVNGTASITIAPKELVCLRSGSTTASVPAVPTGLYASNINAPVALNWNNTVKAASWKVKRATVSGGPYTTIATTATTSYDDLTAANGTVYYYVVSAVNSVGESANSSEVACTPAPFPWVNIDIGSVGLTGSCTVADNGVFTIVGSGSNVGAAVDSFNFTYKTMTGNGSVIARVTSVTNPLMGKVGVMMCENLGTSPKAACVFYDCHSSYLQARMFTRATAGTAASWYNSTVLGLPNWLKLTRSGNVFTGQASTDGTNWTTITTSTIAMASTIYVGLEDTSRNTAQWTTALFDNVTAPCEAPTNLTQSSSNGQIQLGWTASYGAASYNIKRAATAGGTYTTVGTVNAPAVSFTDTATGGSNRHYVVSAVNTCGESPNSAELKAWTNVDIGTTGLAGSFSASANGAFTTIGAGTNFGTTSDAFNYTYRTLTGDGTLIARVSGVTNPLMSKVGLMMMETLSPTSKYACVFYDNHQSYLQTRASYRNTTGGTGTWINSTVYGLPNWLKLVRSGDTFTSYGSTDGVNWTTVTTGTISMASTIYAGFVDTSRNTSQLTTATFDNITAP